MDAERLRTFLLTLPHVEETVQWGGSLVFWVGDKAIGGKMFALVNLNPESHPGRTATVIMYSAGPSRYSELLEMEGLRPAPYMARIYWIAAEHWQVFRNPEWHDELTAAHALTYAKLPPRVRATLAQPAAAQKRLIADRRKTLAAAKATAKLKAK
jgi:predicted DNA-binding protein (MmcQ/YjbR family)